MTQPVQIGVIGGSGFYEMDGLSEVERVKPFTAFGAPSDEIVLATLSGVRLAFLPRHGRGHRLLPTEVPARANIAALKGLGVRRILSFSAVGSLQQKYAPRDFVIPDQLVDRTRHRPDTFFGEGIVGHVGFADPFANKLGDVLFDELKKMPVTSHRGGTIVCMEGPLFSTRGESELYRSWGCDLINMSAVPESKLAREAGIEYALVCMVTDYDCWHDSHADVDIQMVIANLTANAGNAAALIRRVLPAIAAAPRDEAIANACQFAVITSPDKRPPATVAKLRGIIDGV
ncbi:MAG TPA: S-methyl-5'-thioadenosine phosphorylase [Planctomycetota bacterium]|nr:S-methyl-5'-thioadenosine phosphorylase [Planctomycetota bacterium]